MESQENISKRKIQKIQEALPQVGGASLKKSPSNLSNEDVLIPQAIFLGNDT